MTKLPATLIEPGIGYWRSTLIDEDGFPTSLTFHDDVRFGKVAAIFPAIVTKLDTSSDIAFLSLVKDDTDNPIDGMMNLRRAKQLVKGAVHSIADCVHEGQRLMVQVLSEPSSLENKSLSVTPRPRLDGRYVSVEAGASRLNFSKDLGPKTIKALEEPLSLLSKNAAIIVRARAANVAHDTVIAEAKWLVKALTSQNSFALSPMEKALIAVPDGDQGIYIEGGQDFASAKALAQQKWPDLVERMTLYKGTSNAFEEFSVEEAIEEAISDRIILPSGGWISIHETPALTSIDVNMGGALREMSAAEAKLTVNMEAALAIAHHLKFQDIGGLIVVDFIDMSGKGTAAKLLELFDKALKEDRVPVRRSGISAFGLVEMSRQRKGVSLRDRYQLRRAPIERVSERAMALLRKAMKLGYSSTSGLLIVQCDQSVQSWFDKHTFAVENVAGQTQRSIIIREGRDDVFIEAK
jgi:Rne/Rng family ribonuclease